MIQTRGSEKHLQNLYIHKLDVSLHQVRQQLVNRNRVVFVQV